MTKEIQMEMWGFFSSADGVVQDHWILQRSAKYVLMG